MADNPFSTAVSLILSGDPTLTQIISLSLRVSLSAVLIACLIGLPLGAGLALVRFRGRAGVIVTFNALMGLPPVVAGLLIYLLLSRSGPLGSWQLLFTPSAMIAAPSTHSRTKDVRTGAARHQEPMSSGSSAMEDMKYIRQRGQEVG